MSSESSPSGRTTLNPRSSKTEGLSDHLGYLQESWHSMPAAFLVASKQISVTPSALYSAQLFRYKIDRFQHLKLLSGHFPLPGVVKLPLEPKGEAPFL